jgi:hypothetical protein
MYTNLRLMMAIVILSNQNRKRRRVQDLSRDPTMSLLRAEEFDSSYLLGRNTRWLRTHATEAAHSSSSSSGDIGSCAGSGARDCLGEGKTGNGSIGGSGPAVLDSGNGSEMMQLVLKWMDEVSSRLAEAEEQLTSPLSSTLPLSGASGATEAQPSTSNGSSRAGAGDVCASCKHTVSPPAEVCLDVMDLREAIVTLLLLERNAMKWYKEQSVPYFVQLAKRIDLAVSSFASISIAPPSSSSSCPCRKCWCLFVFPPSESTSAIQTILARLTTHLIATLQQETKTLESVMLSFPSKPGGAPQAFLDLDPHGKWTQVLELDLDRDGLEIISG